MSFFPTSATKPTPYANPQKMLPHQIPCTKPPSPWFRAFDEVTLTDVDKLLSDSSTKQCELDSAPTWLLKSLRSVFVPILALLINASISQSTLPDTHKHAILSPESPSHKKNLALTHPSDLKYFFCLQTCRACHPSSIIKFC